MLAVLELYQKSNMADFVIKNYDDLDAYTLQSLIEFSEDRGGFFREDLKRFSIRKRADRDYFLQIFKLAEIDVDIREPLQIVDVFATQLKGLETPREADEIIGFGKHKGNRWGDLPLEYLKWVQGSMQGYSADIARKVMIYKKACERQKQD